MATNWIYYPQAPTVESATLTVTTGTCANVANCLNNRILSKIAITALGTYDSGADEFMFKIDKGAANTSNFIALVNNNLYTDTGKMQLYYDLNDNAGLLDPAAVFARQSAVAANEPIWLFEFSDRTTRYLWLLLDSISTSATFGCMLIGAVTEPSVDPVWEAPIDIDIESGRMVNYGHGGYNWKTRTHGVKRGWTVKYEFIGDSDLAILRNWIEVSPYTDTPFVFTTNGGATYHYGELLGNPIYTPMQHGLHNYEFTISEVIA